ncbi:MAG: hypothetical protein JWQ73_3236 [Variovorax sp.]|nr:hypothetical protein [Variovorax sp.]
MGTEDEFHAAFNAWKAADEEHTRMMAAVMQVRL